MTLQVLNKAFKPSTSILETFYINKHLNELLSGDSMVVPQGFVVDASFKDVNGSVSLSYVLSQKYWAVINDVEQPEQLFKRLEIEIELGQQSDDGLVNIMHKIESGECRQDRIDRLEIPFYIYNRLRDAVKEYSSIKNEPVSSDMVVTHIGVETHVPASGMPGGV
jgi:hypothetical protein